MFTDYDNSRQFLPNNPGVIDKTICNANTNINGYECDGFEYSVLRFKALSYDARK